MQHDQLSDETIALTVQRALEEDLGSGDVTSRLLPAEVTGSAHVITREKAVLCGRPWVDSLYRQLDREITLTWLAADGDEISDGQEFLVVNGRAARILTGERTALNFLQTLSATATICRYYCNLVKHTGVRLLDTRKTLPGLREAQKYAVRCGGGYNHRLGLYDQFLIKENHIAACGSITTAVKNARTLAPELRVEVEVENSDQLREAIASGADIIMLDNFTLDATRAAVALRQELGCTCELEASGGVERDEDLVALAETGVDCISMGALTKNCDAIDLSMRLRIDSSPRPVIPPLAPRGS
jgi:nicotinate-nucleotide pyrophosphorylase (carboxylating)